MRLQMAKKPNIEQILELTIGRANRQANLPTETLTLSRMHVT